MNFLTGIAKIILWLLLISSFIYIFAGADSSSKATAILTVFACVVILTVMRRVRNSKLPGGLKGSAIQGIWMLEKHFRFEPNLKKYESLPVAPDKNYFEFKGSNFRSGDFDEEGNQLPAEYSPFSIVGDNLIFESEFFKKANWKWSIKGGKLELTGETTEPKYGKSQFIFYRKK
jgi:hypothetical protein